MSNNNETSRIRNMVIQYTFTLQRLTLQPRYARMRQAEDIVRLEQEMQNRVVAFSYLGQDNQIHHVKGTLRHYMKDFRIPYRVKAYNRFMLYYDPDVNGWRTFQVSGLIEIS